MKKKYENALLKLIGYGIIILYIAFVVGIIYVGWHFISKFW